MGTIKSNPRSNKRFDVALSFAEENRPFVDAVAELLTSKGVKFFYDDYERTNSWGKDLKKYLRRVYGKEARCCVVFISEYYMKKRWTLFELHCSMERRFFRRNKTYILPFLLDNTEVKGITDATAYLSLERHNEQKLVERIIEKLEEVAYRSLWAQVRRFVFHRVRLTVIILSFLSLVSYVFADNLTPVIPLTRRIYERNTEVIPGSRCNDSSFSHKRGRGTCSGHQGVAYPHDSIIYHKTWEESRKEAEETSWFSGDQPTNNDTAKHTD